MLFFWLLLYSLLAICSLNIIDISSVSEIIAKPVSLIYFYASDCQYCQAFSEDFEFLTHIYNTVPGFQVVKINGRDHKYLRDLFEVTSYPTLKLYDNERKQVSTFAEDRLIQNLQRFIKDHANIEPDTSEFSTDIVKVATVADIDKIKRSGKAVLVAFVAESNHIWRNYFYPNHFYRSLSYQYPEIEFTINFMDDGGSDLLEIFHVSNFPSMILFEGSQIGILNTLSTNALANFELEDKDIQDFLQDYASRKHGVWFENLDVLSSFANSMGFDRHKQRKLGVNYIESKLDDSMVGLGLEEQYLALVDKVTL